ncbi:hypothetical protein [Acinetobacter lactucae]|uniref:hypothetical protein n=1 Tax=Acinetobacter lactucae TaxID=1785128 RepID=UPI00077E3536|nr:hypothetical protein [Acinetobacter lactucae]
MNYHSETLAFKKSELLAVLQAIDKNFSFDSIKPSEPPLQRVISADKQDSSDYNKILFKKPLLSQYEAACIISGIGLYLVLAFNDEFEAKIEYPNWGGALDYIKTCIKEGLLETEGSFMEHIKRDDLKSFLASENIIIEGFNNNFKPINFIEKEQLILQRVELNDEKINVENANLSELVAKQKLEIEQLKKDIANERAISLSSCIDKNKAEKEVAKLQEHIKQLESEQTLEKSDQSKLLSLIFDESATERYAPDLVLSIKLWESIYINNPKNDSHSNKANSWITMNTGYDLSRPSATKLREITTPLVNWSTLRDRNYKK